MVESNGRRLGAFGRLRPEIRSAWDIDRPVHAAVFDLADLLAARPGLAQYREPSRFPASRRDLAFLVDRSVPEADVVLQIRRLGGELLREATLFDRFTGPPLPDGKVSLAYALSVQADDRTLSDEEVRKVEKRIAEGLRSRLGAELRDG